VKAYIGAARLRTLPLAAAVVAMGDICVRLFYPSFYRFEITGWILITAILLQVLSNFANDYGDFKKGTDIYAKRKDRAMSSGRISESKMIVSLVLISGLSLLSGLKLLWVAFDGDLSKGFIFMLGVGLLAILASITYTIGKNAYGYKALGDLFVFIFFGPVAVLGCVYLHATDSFVVQPNHVFPACVAASCCMGFASTAVLTINNIRDIEKDKSSGKTTIPVLLGYVKAKMYFYTLVIAMLISFVVFISLTDKDLGVKLFVSIIALLIFTFRIMKIALANRQTPFFYYMRELKYFSISVLVLPLLSWF